MMIGSGNGGDLPEPGTHAEIVLADGGGAPVTPSCSCLNTFERASPRPSSSTLHV